ncbi:MAG: glycosyltransferase [Gemmatimonadetes bacterium]|nr:glycosyltransferase [Gemmatimonadota bacterium]
MNPGIALAIETDGPGGAERMVAQMGTCLRAKGYRVVVVLPEEGEGWLAGELRNTGVETDTFRIDHRLDFRCARKLAEVYRRHHIALAHSHEFSAAVYGAWAAWLAGIPHVITMHGSRYYAGRLRRRLALRTAMATSGSVVAVSRTLARHIARDLWIRPSHVRVLMNGAQLSPVSESTLRNELGLGATDRLLLSVGNLYPVKGHRHLLEALARLSRDHSTIHVAIAGRGELKGSLRQAAQDLGIASRVHFLGLRSDIPNLLAAADAFVLPSLSEGLPLALLEAMLAGCPVVASNVGEIRAVLAGGEAGRLVPPGDPAALAAAISALLANPAQARALGAAAAQRAARRYSVERMSGRYEEIYLRLLKSRRKRGSGRNSPTDAPLLLGRAR